jgi:hypothetical protein
VVAIVEEFSLKVVSKQVADDQIKEFFALYISLRDAAGDRILARQDMTIRAVSAYAADMTIVEMVNDEEWIVRLNGTRHSDSASTDRTGHNTLATCSPEERVMRRGIAEKMFALPCGIFAVLVQTYEDGSKATLHTTTLPLLGKSGEKLIVTYGPLVEDIEDTYRPRPALRSIEVVEHTFADLGYGVPE